MGTMPKCEDPLRNLNSCGADSASSSNAVKKEAVDLNCRTQVSDGETKLPKNEPFPDSNPTTTKDSSSPLPISSTVAVVQGSPATATSGESNPSPMTTFGVNCVKREELERKCSSVSPNSTSSGSPDRSRDDQVNDSSPDFRIKNESPSSTSNTPQCNVSEDTPKKDGIPAPKHVPSNEPKVSNPPADILPSPDSDSSSSMRAVTSGTAECNVSGNPPLSKIIPTTAGSASNTTVGNAGAPRPDELTESAQKRLLRKRQAARIRQQRCRARKRAAAAAAAAARTGPRNGIPQVGAPSNASVVPVLVHSQLQHSSMSHSQDGCESSSDEEDDEDDAPVNKEVPAIPSQARTARPSAPNQGRPKSPSSQTSAKRARTSSVGHPTGSNQSGNGKTGNRVVQTPMGSGGLKSNQHRPGESAAPSVFPVGGPAAGAGPTFHPPPPYCLPWFPPPPPWMMHPGHPHPHAPNFHPHPMMGFVPPVPAPPPPSLPISSSSQAQISVPEPVPASKSGSASSTNEPVPFATPADVASSRRPNRFASSRSTIRASADSSESRSAYKRSGDNDFHSNLMLMIPPMSATPPSPSNGKANTSDRHRLPLSSPVQQFPSLHKHRLSTSTTRNSAGGNTCRSMGSALPTTTPIKASRDLELERESDTPIGWLSSSPAFTDAHSIFNVSLAQLADDMHDCDDKDEGSSTCSDF